MRSNQAASSETGAPHDHVTGFRRGTLSRLITGVVALALIGCIGASKPADASADVTVSGAVPATRLAADRSAAAGFQTTTPIKHLVVIFQENVSFDHYFGTYPHALNPSGEPPFTPRGNTPQVNGLTQQLLRNNPNTVQPFRLDRSQALTCDQSHTYTAEQQAEDNGAMDKFVQYTEGKATKPNQYCPNGTVMGYYDGNTVTALWNYAQHFAMSDNAFGTVFGPSTPGAIDLAAADTGGALCGPSNSVYHSPGTCSAGTEPLVPLSTGTMYRDTDPYYDDCSNGGKTNKATTTAMSRKNIGDALTSAHITWGWFQGGFADYTASHPLIAVDQLLGINPTNDAVTYGDYSPHHDPFQYYASTANPHHLAPSSDSMIGQTDAAGHQYDLTKFWTAADAGNLPAVSFLKAPGYQDGHAASSDPLDEQTFLVNAINHLMSLPSWRSTAVVIEYDDSDGWYDHVRAPIVNHSNTALDSGCGTSTDGAPARCGYGPRLPYLVISPYARDNYVDHSVIDQTSTVRFIEDNWLGAQRLSPESFDNRAGSIAAMFDFNHPGGRRLFLDPQRGEVLPDSGAFEVTFPSQDPAQGMVFFGSGPGCAGLVEVATRDEGSGTTSHGVLVTGNDLPGTVGDNGIIPGATYWYETVAISRGAREQIDNNNGKCYSVTIPPTSP